MTTAPTELVPLPELDERGRARFSHGGRSFAVFLVDGKPVVFDEACPHRGGPLSEGLVRAGAVICPWHWYAFDLRSGRCRTSEQYELRRHPVIERDGRLFVELLPPQRRSWAELLRAHAAGNPRGPVSGA